MKKLLLFLVSCFSFIISFSQDSLFTSSDTPCSSCNESERALEVGMVFNADKDGQITYVRFYKFKNDTGPYQLNIWSFSGQKLSSTVFSSPATGWQRVKLAEPLKINAGENYIVSYFSTNGHYSARQRVHNSSKTNGQLTAPASNQAKGNGRYVYTKASAFPSSSWNGSWYYVDIVYESSGTEPPPPNPSPLVVKAGADASAVLSLDSCGLAPPFVLYQLQGQVSGDDVAYQWSGEGFSSNILNPQVKFTNPGEFVFTLSARDHWGIQASDQVKITVAGNPKDVIEEKLRDGTIRTKEETTPPPAPNLPPEAKAGPDKTITLPVNSVQLSGEASDPENRPVQSEWTKIMGPASAVIQSPGSAVTTVTALTEGKYVFRLLVVDDQGLQATDDVTVTVLKEQAPPPPVNAPPTANAGDNQEITLPVNTVTLKGSGSDPEGGTLTYLWTRLTGSGSISSPNMAVTSITGLAEGQSIFQLKVTDDQSASAVVQVSIIVHPAITPSPGEGNKYPLQFTQISTDYNRINSGAEMWYNGFQYPVTNVSPQDRYYRFNWAGLNPGDGQYNWSVFDQQVNTCIDNNQGFSFGIMAQYPGGKGSVNIATFGGAASAYPEWVHNQMQSESVKDYIYQGDWVPNWNSVAFLNAMEKFNNAVYAHLSNTVYKGVRYKDVINEVDIRGYGSFGEWHNYPQGSHAGTDPTAASLSRMIDIHINAYPDLQLQMMVDGLDGGGWSNIPAQISYKLLTARNKYNEFGIRRDSWGATEVWYNSALWENNPGSYNGQQFKTLIMAKWKTTPITGEPCCANGYADLPAQVTKYHVLSFGNGNYGAATPVNVVNASRNAGARIRLLSGEIITNSGSLSLSLTWQNDGLTPCYKAYTVIIELRQGNNVVKTLTSGFMPNTLQPGDTQAKTDNFNGIATGTYSVFLKVKDNYRNFILGTNGRQSDGSYSLGSVTIP